MRKTILPNVKMWWIHDKKRLQREYQIDAGGKMSQFYSPAD